LAHLLKHLAHLLKHLAHLFKHLAQLLKDLAHMLKHLAHLLKHLAHLLKHLVHLIKRLAHLLKHLAQAGAASKIYIFSQSCSHHTVHYISVVVCMVYQYYLYMNYRTQGKSLKTKIYIN
jgi:hypothetical protein